MCSFQEGSYKIFVTIKHYILQTTPLLFESGYDDKNGVFQANVKQNLINLLII